VSTGFYHHGTQLPQVLPERTGSGLSAWAGRTVPAPTAQAEAAPALPCPVAHDRTTGRAETSIVRAMGQASGQVDYAPAGAPVAAATTPTTTPAHGAPLTPEQMRAITLARQRGRRIGRAAVVAAVSGWTLAFFAFITLLTGIFSLPALLLGLGLGAVAFVELRGWRGLRLLDERAPRMLGFNQLALATLISAYAAWGMWQAATGPGPYESYLAMLDRFHYLTFAQIIAKAIEAGMYKLYEDRFVYFLVPGLGLLILEFFLGDTVRRRRR